MKREDKGIDPLINPQYPSPTTCLNEELQLELEERMAKTNRLLLDLALSNEQPLEARRRAFDALMNHKVTITLKGGNIPGIQRKRVPRTKRLRKKQQTKSQKSLLKGCVQLVGWDFIQLGDDHCFSLIPSLNISSIKSTDPSDQPIKTERLEEIDPWLRQALVFHFGEVVSGSPELIQIFFRLHLSNFLLLLVNRNIQIFLQDNKVERGEITDVTQETLTLCIGEETYKEIPFEFIRYLTGKKFVE